MRIVTIFPRDSAGLFAPELGVRFGGASVQMRAVTKALGQIPEVKTISLVPAHGTAHYEELGEFVAVPYNQGVFAVLRTLVRLWRQHRPEVVVQHGLSLGTLWLALLLPLVRARLVFMVAHDIEADGCLQSTGRQVFWAWLVYKFAAVVTTQHAAQARRLQERYGRASELCYVSLSTTEKPLSVPECNTVLWMARSENWKRPLWFIALAKKFPQLQFVMICPTTNVSCAVSVAAEARGVANLTLITGVPYEETWQYFAKARVFVSTSVFEGYPQTFIQAVEMGVPILSVDVNPNNLLTAHGCGRVITSFEGLLTELPRIYDTVSAYDASLHTYAQTFHSMVALKQTLRNVLTL